MAATYFINGKKMLSNDANFEKELAIAYGSKKRPFCCCMNPSVEMYISKRHEKLILNRMPNTGGHHHPECESYEMPAELSGLGQVSGSAIKENIEDGTVTLKLDFALSKGASRSAPVASGLEQDSVTTDGKKLTLRSMLHYLWEQASFNKWYPTMDGKRSWFVIRKYLLEAAKNKVAKGGSLDGNLYIPESFVLDKKDELTKRRIEAMKHLSSSVKGAQPLMIIIGEVKDFDKTRFDHKIVIKHLPNFDIILNADIHKRLFKRFADELTLWNAHEDSHLMFIGTFGIDSAGVASFVEVALMMVDKNWLPYENVNEYNLVAKLTESKHSFIKSLRYNLPSTKPLSSALDTTKGDKTALYVINGNATDEFRTELEELLAESEVKSWVWDASAGDMPELP